MGRFTEALTSFVRALFLDPSMPDAWMGKGVVLGKLGRNTDAMQAFEQALQLNPDCAAVWYTEGRVFRFVSRSEERMEVTDRMPPENPNTAEAWGSRGFEKALAGLLEEAVQEYDNELRTNFHSAPLWYNRGVALDGLGRTEEALHSYENALNADPAMFAAWYNKGLADARLGQFTEALSNFDQALALDTGAAIVWVNKGLAFFRLFRFEEELSAYDAALLINPRMAVAWYNKGVAQKQQDRGREALISFERAIALDPGMVRAWLNKGAFHSREGAYEFALQAYDMVLSLDPLYLLAWVGKNFVLINIGRSGAGKKAFIRANQVDPQLYLMRRNYGGALFFSKRSRNYVAFLDKKRKIPHDASLVWYSTGLSLYQNHRKEEAIGAFHRVLAIDPASPAAGITSGWLLRIWGSSMKLLKRTVMQPGWILPTNSTGTTKDLSTGGWIRQRLPSHRFTKRLRSMKNTSMAGTTWGLSCLMYTGIPRLQGLLTPHWPSNPGTLAPSTESITRNSKQVSPEFWKWSLTVPFLDCEYDFSVLAYPFMVIQILSHKRVVQYAA
jgi:tetratricopeptide (TPR) repeat protein